MRALRLWGTLVVVAATAQADAPAAKLEQRLAQFESSMPPEFEAPKLVFLGGTVELAPSAHHLEANQRVEKLVVGYAGASKDLAWVATDLRQVQPCIEQKDISGEMNGDPIVCGRGNSKVIKIDGQKHNLTNFVGHATGLFERRKGLWQPVVWHSAVPITGKEQAEDIKSKTKAKAEILEPLPRKIAGAEDVVKQFESTIDDPKKYIATLSKRADTVLYGSEASERFVGPQVKQTLDSWKLSLKVRDGVMAGVVGGNLAWVAANVDAGNAKIKPVPFRLLAIYEKAGGAWTIVALHFSFPNAFPI